MHEYPLKCPQGEFGFLDESMTIARADPGVAGDAQQSKAHLEGYPPGNGAEGTIAVGEVAGIFPEKVADKGFGGIFVARGLQKKVLEFPGDAPDIEDTISSLHAFQVDGNDAQPVAKEEVGWGSIAVDQHLLVFPHTRLFTPALTEPVELVRFVSVDELSLVELAHQTIKIGTILVKINAVAVGGAVMQGSQEVSQGRELCKEFVSLPMRDGCCDDVAQRPSTAILLNE